MLHLRNLFLQRGYVLSGHVLQNDQRKRALVEFRQQLVLADHRVHVLGQIIQHVVIDAGIYHAQHGRNQQHQRQNKNEHAVLHHRIG